MSKKERIELPDSSYADLLRDAINIVLLVETVLGGPIPNMDILFRIMDRLIEGIILLEGFQNLIMTIVGIKHDYNKSSKSPESINALIPVLKHVCDDIKVGLVHIIENEDIVSVLGEDINDQN